LNGTPAAEHVIDEALVSRLLAEQHPDLASLPLSKADAGWDNELFRLGDRLAVRLPRRALAARLIEHEQRWLPIIAPALPLPVPAPYRKGMPSHGYPWCWSVVPWLDGVGADTCEPDPAQAQELGKFLSELHVPAPADAPTNPFRGVPLKERATSVMGAMERLASRTELIPKRIRETWNEALSAPVATQRVWVHGDLHPRNVLVRDGVISGVIDWGDVNAGDAATDLASSWMLFECPSARDALAAAYGKGDPAAWARAKGWAVLFGIMFLETGLVDHPRHAEIGARILRRVLD